MVFYVGFPILIKTLRAAFIFLILSAIVSYAIRYTMHLQYLDTTPLPRYDWSYFAFLPNLWFSSLGIFIYFLGKSQHLNAKLLVRYSPIFATVTIGGLLFFDLGGPLRYVGRLDIVAWGVGLASLCVWQVSKPSYIIANYVMEWVGERSYSIYLIHPVIILATKSYLAKVYEYLFPQLGVYAYFVCVSILLIIVLAVAQFTYKIVEVNGIYIGRKLITIKNRIL